MHWGGDFMILKD